MKDEEFEKIRDGIISKLKQPFTKVEKKAREDFNQIVKMSYGFDKKKRDIDEVMKFTRDEMVKMYKEIFLDNKRC